MSSSSFDIDLPPPPTVPSWLGSLCSQIDGYKDFTLPQVFTPRNVPEEYTSQKRPSAKTEKDRRLSSSHLTQNEFNKTFGDSQLTRQDSIFQKSHSHYIYNSHDLYTCALIQPETEKVPVSQPWPSLQPVPERQSCHDSDQAGDWRFTQSSQPWPSCDVKQPSASQACRITNSRLTYSYLPSVSSSQTRQPSSGIDSPPDLFGNSPTYSPLSSYTRDVRRDPSVKALPVSLHNDRCSSVLQTGHWESDLSRAAVDSEPGNGEKNARRYLCSAGSKGEVSISSKHDQRGESATPQTGTICNPYTPAVINFQGAGGRGMKLHSVEEIPKPFCDIFPFPFFNAVQSMAFDKLMYTDSSVVVSAPTGSGKTALFELAIVRLLLCVQLPLRDIKVVYIGPMKSLCGERVDDWRRKLSPLGLECLELTGDSDLSDVANLHHAQVICTTPEKWDSVTRRWKDNRQLFQSICLVCIDEVHVVGDTQRGATVEAVITRMKMVRTLSAGTSACPVRFIAASATLPNTEDIGEWLSSHSSQAAVFKLGEEYRPVRLQRVVLGYPFSDGSSEFRFDLNLTYKLHSVIDNYCHGKPTLVFCSSRKSCQQTAETLVKRRWGQSSFVIPQHRQEIRTAASRIQEKKLSELLLNGVGIHHAGLEVQDRKLVEELFRAGKLAVLIATSTLSVGVNLPAHLVVVKATHLYVMGVAREYSDQQVLQMIGRAGRPQFDTSATVVIMTKAQLKAKYEALVNGKQVIESMLHKNLTEHVNVEVVLNTITDMADAASWLSHTLLHVRATKNPRHYGLPSGLNTKQVEQKLQDMCMMAISKLNSLHLVSVDPDTAMTSPTERGRLMARYCLEYDTVKQFMNIPLKSGIEHLIGVISTCSEFQDIQLRISEKKTLNSLNKNKNQETIRYPLKDKIKTRQMKVNCLVQAGLGCLHIQDYSLSQDLQKIFRVGQRVTKCLMELQWLGEDYTTLLHSIQLCKAFKARLWPDSRHVARQLEGIGPTISQALVLAGLTSFQLLEAADPQHLELVVNRHPPFGNRVRDAVTHLPRYELIIQQEKNHQAASAQLAVSVSMLNVEDIQASATCGPDHQLVVIIGDEDNNVVFKWKLWDRMLLSQVWRRRVDVRRALAGSILHVGLISLDWVGLDIHTEYQPFYTSIYHPHRLLKNAQTSAESDNTDSTAMQLTKRGKPTPAGSGQHQKGQGQKGEGQRGGRQSGTLRGQKADSKIQQQLDVMHFKLQQFHYTGPALMEKLTHDRKGTCTPLQQPATLPDVRGQNRLQNLPAMSWEEENLSPEVNLLTEPWGDLVDDFWDESDFDEPPAKAPKKTDSKTGVSESRNQVSSEDKLVPSPGNREMMCGVAGVRGDKQTLFPTSQTQTVTPTVGCSSIDTGSTVRTNGCSRTSTNPAVRTTDCSRAPNPAVRTTDCSRAP
ncbi:putative ATP-dependent DNA helicase HFM1, partial [Babylonia areolata]|uniref:putative ATP-dependent DNA helicase HFM1 n=1 Tax=Babylonia areolata TaxID=304850 RepID=UPI003FD12AB9